MSTQVTSPNPQADETKKNQHADGKFARGNKGGPGNPHGPQVAKLRAVLLEMIDEKDMADIFRALIDRAKEGNLSAIRLVLQYTLGKPQLMDADPFALAEPMFAAPSSDPPTANVSKQGPSANGVFNSGSLIMPPPAIEPLLSPKTGQRQPLFDNPAETSLAGKRK